MKEKEMDTASFFEQLKAQVKEYTILRMDLVKADLAAKTAKSTGALFSILILMFLLFFVLLFVSLVAGFFFARQLGSLLSGFGIIACFYTVLFIVCYVFRKQLIELPVANRIISIIFENDHDKNN